MLWVKGGRVAFGGLEDRLNGGVGGVIGAEIADKNGSDDAQHENYHCLHHLLGAEGVAICKPIGFEPEACTGERTRR